MSANTAPIRIRPVPKDILTARTRQSAFDRLLASDEASEIRQITRHPTTLLKRMTLCARVEARIMVRLSESLGDPADLSMPLRVLSATTADGRGTPAILAGLTFNLTALAPAIDAELVAGLHAILGVSAVDFALAHASLSPAPSRMLDMRDETFLQRINTDGHDILDSWWTWTLGSPARWLVASPPDSRSEPLDGQETMAIAGAVIKHFEAASLAGETSRT